MAARLRGAKFADRNASLGCFHEKGLAVRRKLKTFYARVLAR
jgi:hypothetical protein